MMTAGPAPALVVRQVVLKVHGRCNLACGYCYVYQHADQTWRNRPRRMSDATVGHAALRIAEHVDRHSMSEIEVILHGGEPLLASVDDIEALLARIRAAVAATCEVRFVVQTNGIRLDRSYLNLLERYRVSVGVSLDGPKTENDRHRRYANGRSSSAEVERALQLLGSERYRHLYAGVLCTIDVRNDPIRVYEGLLRFAPPTIDLLLPHGTWTSPPPGRIPGDPATPYADWLVAVFDRWYGAPAPETKVRLFEALISLLIGGSGGIEALGGRPADAITVETDGALELTDAYKTTTEGFAATGLYVASASFDDAFAQPAVRRHMEEAAALNAQCRGCPVVSVCGGGLVAHRYRSGSFQNPSVYCPDLFRLVEHTAARVRNDLPPEVFGPGS